MKNRDERYMAQALRLAAKARGRTSPNPMVGAVVVKSGRVIAAGYHRKAGEPHAEAIALRKAGRSAKGATLYVTLEPCTHTKKRTPPCSPLVIASGVRRVVVAMIDPNPRVSGEGIRALRREGIEVRIGVLKDEAERLNEAFIKHMTTGMPFVTMKIAQTLDGRIATASGESKWITGPEARAEGHRLRDRNDAILVGINTVLKDDPSLTARIPGSRDPLRVVVDSRLRISLKAKVITHRSMAGTLIATTRRASSARAEKLRKAGAEVLVVRSAGGRADLADLMRRLGKRDVQTVLIEGGSEVNASALEAGIVDKAVLFIAPMLMTGKDSLPSIGGRSPRKLSQSVLFSEAEVCLVGDDLMIEGYIAK